MQRSIPAPKQGDKPTRILFMAEAVTLAHVARPLALAQSLNRLDFEVCFACDPRAKWALKDVNFEHHDIQSKTSEAFLSCLDRGQPVYSEADLIAYVHDDLALIEKVKPNFIVGDFRLSLSISARLKNIPYATITNEHWLPQSTQHMMHPWHTVEGLIGRRLAQGIFSLVAPIGSALHASPLNRARRHFGLPGLPKNVRAIYTDADHVLLDDTPGETRTILPSHFFYLGPILWSPSTPLPSWWAKVPRNKPIVYVTLGSSGNTNSLVPLFRALEGLPVTTIIATAGRKNLVDLKDSFFTADFLPGDLAAELCSIVVCNGGSGSTKQAIHAGKPVLGITTNMDQEMTMARLVKKGIGISLHSRVSSHDMQKALNLILSNPRYRVAAEAESAISKRYKAVERFGLFLKQRFNPQS